MSSLAESLIPAQSGRHPYRHLVLRRIVMPCGLLALLCPSVAVDLSLGPARHALADVVAKAH